MSAASQIRCVAPVFLVRDVVRAHEYYAEKLGFRSPRMWGDPPTFCIAQRDGVEIMLNQVASGDDFQPNASFDGRWDAYVTVSDCDALYAEFEANGADLVCAPEDQVYAMREFQVRDLDGHLLAFAHDISGTA